MKTAIVAISMVMMLLLTGGMALAAPAAPGNQGHGPGVEQGKDHGQGNGQAQNQSQAQNQDQTQDHGQGQDNSQAQNSDQNEQHGHAQDNGQAQGNGPDKNKNQGKAPGFDKRHGAAGTVSSLATSCPSGAPTLCTDSFVLQTNQDTITVVVTKNTRFSSGKNTTTFSDLKIGDHVNVNGTRVTDSSDKTIVYLVAKIVHVIPSQASVEHSVGTVESYTAANGTTNGSITIKDRRTGLDVTFTVTSSTKIEGKNPPATGDLVTIVAFTTSGAPTARGIAVETPDTN